MHPENAAEGSSGVVIKDLKKRDQEMEYKMEEIQTTAVAKIYAECKSSTTITCAHAVPPLYPDKSKPLKRARWKSVYWQLSLTWSRKSASILYEFWIANMISLSRFFHNFKDFYNEINTATLTGAIDVIVVEQPDGSYSCSPFHVRFGKLGVLRSREKIVDIEINGEPQGIHMKLGESGEAFFVEPTVAESEEIPEHLATSPIPMSHLKEIYEKQGGRRRNSITLAEMDKSFNMENQVNDYSRRRYTADVDDEKLREREFIKRQMGILSMDIGEQSTEDLTLSIQSTKLTSDEISKDEISESIFRMDSLEMDVKEGSINKDESQESLQGNVKSKKADVQTPETSKSVKKKKRKKSMMKKKNSQRKTNNTNEIAAEDTAEITQETSVIDLKPGDSVTDSSFGSNNSESDVKDISKSEVEELSGTLSSRKVNRDPDIHFFSDTDLAEQDSRPNTPIHVESVQSDTEFEVQKSKGDNKEDQGQSWAWGEFPVTTANTSTSESFNEQKKYSSMFSMFSFMKQSKHRRHNSNSDGMYLADLSSGTINPEVAALYFINSREKKRMDSDMESGNGPSLVQSPNSADGGKSIDSDFDDHKGVHPDLQNMTISMCGWDPEPTNEMFTKHLIQFSDLCNNPTLLDDPNLVIRLHEKYYNIKVAMPLMFSLLVFQRSLPQSAVQQLCNQYMPQPVIREKESKQQESRYSWWNWRRNRTSREVTPALETPQTEMVKCVEVKEVMVMETLEQTMQQDILNEEVQECYQTSSHSAENDNTKDITEEKVSTNSEKCRKTLRLSSDQIAYLNLRDGMNEIVFSVTTAYQGTTRCQCHLYKWKWDDKIVISDIDGTITKSDVLGHLLPIVGRDWAQSGVAQLFNKIKDNGYKLLYLSARAIGQARITRDYLKSIRQGDLSMPDGPVLLNPTSLISAFHREVIEKKPEQFKISCLTDIRALFPDDSNPFYAGYGNRINDVWSYRAVGIPIVRIFTINSKGELKHELTQTFQSSYSNMSHIVDQLFPPLLEDASDFSQFVYWRDPLPSLEAINNVSHTN